MVKLTPDQFNKKYAGDNITAYVLSVTKQQYSNLLMNLNYYVNYPTEYSILNRNCTSVVINSLKAADILGPIQSRFVDPSAFGQKLEKLYQNRDPLIIKKYLLKMNK